MNDYAQDWKRYRRLVLYWVIIFAAYIPVVWITYVTFERLFKTDAEFPYVAGFWACLWVASFIRICAFPCPRCGKCFIGEWWFGNFSMRRNCAYCSLQRDPDALAVFPSSSKS
jgi:hypothetical protein